LNATACACSDAGGSPIRAGTGAQRAAKFPHRRNGENEHERNGDQQSTRRKFHGRRHDKASPIDERQGESDSHAQNHALRDRPAGQAAWTDDRQMNWTNRRQRAWIRLRVSTFRHPRYGGQVTAPADRPTSVREIEPIRRADRRRAVRFGASTGASAKVERLRPTSGPTNVN
jgi:hypothetical protein